MAAAGTGLALHVPADEFFPLNYFPAQFHARKKEGILFLHFPDAKTARPCSIGPVKSPDISPVLCVP
jgi:hypothetical protein